jgi:penicillin amidase
MLCFRGTNDSVMRPPLLKTLAVVPVLLAAALGAAFSYGRASLPVVDGSVVVSGLSGPVQIVRDADYVPHVFAAKRHHPH